jgi:hypothetical protein
MRGCVDVRVISSSASASEGFIVKIERRLTVVRRPIASTTIVVIPSSERLGGDEPEDWLCGKCASCMVSGVRPRTLSSTYPAAERILIECGVCHSYNEVPLRFLKNT